MKYKQVVEVYSQLESTTKRLQKTKIIADFLKKAPADELHTLVLLLEGKIFPSWDENEAGVAAKLILKAISVASGETKERAEREWKKTGDLGKAAELLLGRKKQHTLFSHELTIKKVMDNLRKLPGIEGEGSVDRKIQLIAELLTSASSQEAKYIVKTVLQELRVGVGEGSLRDAIVWSNFSEQCGISVGKEEISIDKREDYNKHVAAVQNAYDLTNDFGVVAEAARKGLRALQDIGLKIGTPIKVMLALKADTIEEGIEVVGLPAEAEYKYDGFRCTTGNTPIYVHQKGLVSIKDVHPGDKVLTHNGYFKKVTAVNKRVIEKGEKLYRIHTFLGVEFKISEGHPLLAFKNGKCQWVEVDDLKKTDELVFPIPKIKATKPFSKKLEFTDDAGYKKSIRINKFFFRFLGYWLGDGYTNEYHHTERIGLIFNFKKDRKLCEYYKKNIKKHFQIRSVSQNIHNGAIYLYWRDKPMRIWLSRNFRREWKGKMLPYWFYGISKRQFDEFMRGWIESDGYVDDMGRTSITTKERDLAMFSHLLALKFKKVMGVRKIRIGAKTYYKLMVPKSKKTSRIFKNTCVVKMLKFEEVRRPDPRITLYNLQVDSDESYCTSMVALHNCQIHKKSDGKIKIFTRRLEDVTTQFPDIVGAVEKHVKGKSFILDSEAVGYDKKTGTYLAFQSISQRIKRKYEIERMVEDIPVEVNVFDALYYEGELLLEKPFKERRKLIDKIIKPSPKKIVPAEHITASSAKEIESFYKKSLKAGNEGIMLKSLSAPYKPGARVGYMVKLKPVMETLDLVIVGAEWGEGKRSEWLSSYVLACADDEGNLLEVGRVSTGLKEKEEEGLSFKEMTTLLKPLIIEEKGKEAKVKPKIVIEVDYEEIQKSPTYASGYALRFPRVKGLREDRSVEDISTLSMVEGLYRKQK
jgi:ATP-dependent DNA ligase